MSQFKKVRDAYVITRSRSGMFREMDVFKHKGELFAKSGSGFYKLYAGFGTSSETVKWSMIMGVEYENSLKGGLSYLRLAK